MDKTDSAGLVGPPYVSRTNVHSSVATPEPEGTSEKVVAWMDEKHAWRGLRAPDKPGTYALVLADDYAALEARVRELEAREEVLQRALDRWLPSIAGADDLSPMHKAASEDASLLYGGWVGEGVCFGDDLIARAEQAEAALSVADLPTWLRWVADELVKRDTHGGTFAPGVAQSLRGRAYVLELSTPPTNTGGGA